MNTQLYVQELTDRQQERVKGLVIETLSEQGYGVADAINVYDNVVREKLCNLSDLIEIEKVFERKIYIADKHEFETINDLMRVLNGRANIYYDNAIKEFDYHIDTCYNTIKIYDLEFSSSSILRKLNYEKYCESFEIYKEQYNGNFIDCLSELEDGNFEHYFGIKVEVKTERIE